MFRRLTILAAAATATVGVPFVKFALAQDLPTSHPLLEQLDRETRGLIADVQGGVVRVQLPPPLWVREIAARENPVNRWGSELNDDVKKRLLEELQSAQTG